MGQQICLSGRYTPPTPPSPITLQRSIEMGVEQKHGGGATGNHLSNIQVNDIVVQEGARGTAVKVGLGDNNSMLAERGLRKSVQGIGGMPATCGTPVQRNEYILNGLKGYGVCGRGNGHISGTFWIHFGYLVGMFWACFGYVWVCLGMFVWVCFGYVLGMFWVCFGHVLGTFR